MRELLQSVSPSFLVMADGFFQLLSVCDDDASLSLLFYHCTAHQRLSLHYHIIFLTLLGEFQMTKMKSCSALLSLLCGLLFLFAGETLGFSSSSSSSLHQYCTRTTTTTTITRQSSVLFQSPNKIYSPDNENTEVTPNQIKALRKEASKRLARNSMEQHSYYVGEEDKDDTASQEAFFSAVSADLEEHELVQIRGVSKSNKRKVYETADQLAEDLSVAMKRPVFVVDIKGFAVTFYCGSLDEHKKGRILLRSSYQEGAWDLKMKAPRDHRGQIVKD